MQGSGVNCIVYSNRFGVAVVSVEGGIRVVGCEGLEKGLLGLEGVEAVATKVEF